jgi:hypothetical protein
MTPEEEQVDRTIHMIDLLTQIVFGLVVVLIIAEAGFITARWLGWMP